MPDENPPRRPAEPASDAKKHANKRVVLSSVAKVAPTDADSLLGEPEPTRNGPPELPPKTSDGGLIRPVGWTTRPGGTTTIIKLPPKTGTLPRLTSLSQRAQENPPTLPPPVAGSADGDDATKRPAPIKIEPPAVVAPTEQESIFAPATPVVTAPAVATPVEAKAPAAPVAPSRAVPPPLPPRSLEKAPAPTSVSAPTVEKPAPERAVHAPPLVPHDSPAPEADRGEASRPSQAPEPKADPMAQTVKLSPPPVHLTAAPAQGQLPLPEAPKPVIPVAGPVAEAKTLNPAPTKHRLPPRSSATGRVKLPPETPAVPPAQKPAVIPPKTFPATTTGAVAPATASAPAAPLASKPQAVKSSVTPPTIPLQGARVRPPTLPRRSLSAAASASGDLIRGDKVDEEEETVPAEEPPPPTSRAEKRRRRRLVGIIVFYVLLVALLPCLYEAALYFTRETRVEGQVIPPPGMLLSNEVWIVTDFRDLAAGIADDLASDRQIVVQDMQEKLGHVQRAQADVATREGRIRLLKDQIQSDNDEEMSLMKQARDAAQHIWDGPGAQLEVDYQSRLTALNQAIAERAKANHLPYAPDPNYYSPEVWANAYRLALYQVPAGVDAVKERTWLDAQMQAWHDFTKAMDQKEISLRQQAAQLKLQPSARVTDLKAQVDDLQQRIDATQAEEEPLKAELEQARADLAAVQAKEAGLDAKPYEMLDALPEKNVTKRLDLQPNGRFSWREVEKENKYAADEKTHVFWIFARAFRSDGRQYWSLNRFSVAKDSTTLVVIEPSSFQSTKAILRPDLSPDDQAR